MANCITTFEGKIVNLEFYEGFGIESHSAADNMFQVKANPSRNASSANSANLTQGTEDACKAYVRDVLAPKLELDVTDPYFVQRYGSPKATETPPAETEDKPKASGRTRKTNTAENAAE